MDYLYTLSLRHGHGHGDFRDLSVHATINSVFFKIYGYLRRDMESGILDKHNTEVDIRDLQEMDKETLFDEYNRLTLFGRFRVTKLRNLTTGKCALEAIIINMDERFEEIRHKAPPNATVCFPVELISPEVEKEWRECDPINADSIMKHLSRHFQIKVNELSIHHGLSVVRKDCDVHESSDFPVSFNNFSSESFFNIVVSPGGGY